VFALLWSRARFVVAAFALVTALAVAMAARLQLHTDFAEMLPSADPAVRALEQLKERVDGTAMLQLAIESPDRDANLRIAAQIAEALRREPREVVATVAYDVRAERQFFLDRRWLYVPLAELEALRQRLEGRKNPLYVDIEDDPRADLDRTHGLGQRLDRFPTGFFEGEDGRLVVVVARPPGGLFGENAGERLAQAARRVLSQIALPAGMTVGLTGDVTAQLEERAALERDLVWATAVCVTLVCLVVVLFYGRVRALPLVGAPALVGVALALAAAERCFGYLNASTAFLGSIVVGNGINFPIVQLARYQEERRAGAAPRDAAETAWRATLRPTGAAALAAALAYGSLTLTRFRGFSQFGVIGAVGMIAAWLAAATLLPSLIALWPGSDRPAARSFALPSAKRPRLVLGLVLAATAASLLPLPRYLRDPFEYDFRKLRNKRSLESGAAALAPRVDRVFGRTITPSVVLADSRAHAAEVKRLILSRDRAGLLDEVTTLDDLLPGDAGTQHKKLAVLADLRRLIDELAPNEKALRPPESLAPVEERDLPEMLRRPFIERDGSAGRIVLVYHAPAFDVWDGRQLERLAALIDPLPLGDGTVLRSSGQAVVFTSMIRSIEHDAPIATAAALAGVALLTLLLAGRAAPLVLGALLCGVSWMAGAAAAFGVRTNFLNFIALPITFGIGVDYGVNMVLRFRKDGTFASTGPAVALCSLTTIIGYGALLAADNQALRSFGTLAILGEIACLSAALLALPAYLMRRRTSA
jgi:predicted RND superfamily exporter protein